MSLIYHKYINFFNNVMIFCGHHGWSIRFCNDSYCWFSHRRIDIDLGYSGDIRQIILHEIAHIDTAKYCNQKHNPAFWKKLQDLSWRFLHTDLDEWQQRHRQYMTTGIYDRCYGR